MNSAGGWRPTLGFRWIQTALALFFCGVFLTYAHAQQTPPAPQSAPAEKTTPPVEQVPGAPASQSAEPAPPPAEPASPPPPVLTAAEQQEIVDIQRPVAELKDKVDRLEKTVERNLENEEELQRLRGELLNIFQQTRTVRDTLKPKSDALHQQIEQLGAPPAKDAAPESAEITTARARLNAIASEVDGVLKNTELVSVRARQLRDTVQTARQNIFASRLLRRSPSPVSPTTWLRISEDAPGAMRQISDTLGGWLSLAKRRWVELSGLVGGSALLFLVLTGLVRWFLSARLDRPREAPPSFFVQAATVGWVAPLFALPALISLNVLGSGLDSLYLLTYEVGQIADAALPALYIFIGVAALTRAMLQPKRPQWRLVDLSTPSARTVTNIITSIAAVFSLDIILQEAVRRLFLPLSIGVMEMALASIAVGLLMLQLVRTPFEPKAVTTGVRHSAPEASIAASPGPISWLRPYLIKIPILIVALAVLGLSLVGYIGLGRFISSQVLISGSVIAIILVFHLAIRALLGAPGTGVKPFATVLYEQFGLDPKPGAILTQSLSILLNGALALAAVPLVLITWRFTPSEALSAMRSLVFGFQIGEFRISLARILIAVVLFLALIFATRIAQRWIDKGVLSSQRIDQGIANSIHTAIGYSGFIIAALVAIAYSGIDITNFAIVAGALSVGIGFGLQSIINNFVSGLILLVERPIKVGDRVMVKDRQGFVRRISVRSTEIETFDKASVIVPNSDLIQSPVTNWTHRNSLGSVTVAVRVSYKSDAEKVRDILQKVGSECSLIMQHPAPSVVFNDFGPNGLEFSVGGVVSDVGKADAARTDLRFRILKAFREAGVEMPYAQYDVHLRDLDLVRSVLTRLAEERARQQQGPRVGDGAKPSGES